MDHLGFRFDEIPKYWFEILNILADAHFILPWHCVYDFVEFLPNNYHAVIERSPRLNDLYVSRCNKVLERNLSGYRFVGYHIAPIVTDHEIAAVEQAMGLPGSLATVSVHIKTALDHLSDRENPNYRNSIKESISAVESLCNRIIGGSPKTLGDALKLIEKKGIVDLHPALNGAFSKMYGYTNVAEGIRHGLLDEPNLDAEDATFMLVTCSAFINYLVQKATKAGMTL